MLNPARSVEYLHAAIVASHARNPNETVKTSSAAGQERLTQRRTSISKECDTLTRSCPEAPGLVGDRRFAGTLDVRNAAVQRLDQFLQRKQLSRLRGRGAWGPSARECPVRIDGGQSRRPPLQCDAVVLTGFDRCGVAAGFLVRPNELEPPFPAAVVSFTRHHARVKRPALVRHGFGELHHDRIHKPIL